MAGHHAALPRVRMTVPVASWTIAADAIAAVLGGYGWATVAELAGLAVEAVVLVSRRAWPT